MSLPASWSSGLAAVAVFRRSGLCRWHSFKVKDGGCWSLIRTSHTVAAAGRGSVRHGAHAPLPMPSWRQCPELCGGTSARSFAEGTVNLRIVSRLQVNVLPRWAREPLTITRCASLVKPFLSRATAVILRCSSATEGAKYIAAVKGRPWSKKKEMIELQGRMHLFSS